ncbi:MAG: ABC transporter ATP-binding protein [Cellulosilyticaceae bacterium]
MSYFEARHLSKRYDQKEIIADIHIKVMQGELVSLLGTSGVGKTTLFNILSGLEMPDQGEVYLGGEEITGKSGIASYMQQKDLLLPYKTIIDNVSLPLVIRGEKVKAAREQATPYLKIFGLEGCGGHYPNQLSGGMRQRAALLRSYMFSSELMLLDEPFSALDAITKHQLHEWYLDIIKEMQTTTLLITHDIDEAILLSDRIYIMAGRPGRLIKEIQIPLEKGKRKAFATSHEFMTYKREIYDCIKNQQ